jgi:hypothetical protein
VGLQIPVNVPQLSMTLTSTVAQTIDVSVNFTNTNGYSMSTVSVKVGYRTQGSASAYTYLPNTAFVNATLSYPLSISGLVSEQAYEIELSLVDSNSSSQAISGTVSTSVITAM